MGSNQQRILIIEDEPDIVELLQYNLEREGFKVFSERDGDNALSEAKRIKPLLIILDLMLPSVDGIDICRKLKAESQTQDIPVIMLTAKGEESDVVLGLGIGADDYVVKPFSPKELIARIRAVIRRASLQSSVNLDRLEAGSIVVDSSRHEVTVSGAPITVTRTEFRLLRALVSQRGRVCTRDQLLDKVSGGESVVIDRNVDVHIVSLRKKLGNEGDNIVTIRGVGYKFRD